MSMKLRAWCCAALLAALGLTVAGTAGETLPPDGESTQRVIVLRVAGKPDMRCLVEESVPMKDGTLKHRVRDLESGKVLTVLDRRGVEDSKGTEKPSTVHFPTPSAPVMEPKTEEKSAVSRPALNVLHRVSKKVPVFEPDRGDPLFPVGTAPKAKQTYLAPASLASGEATPQTVTAKKVEAPQVPPMPSVSVPVRKQKPKEQGLLGRLFASTPPKPKKVAKKPTPVPTPVERPELPQTAAERNVAVLRDAVRPSMRESAAVALIQEPVMTPMITAALVEAAQVDPAPTVRACCIRCLASRHVADPSLLAALPILAEDAHPDVSAEANRAMEVLQVNGEE